MRASLLASFLAARHCDAAAVSPVTSSAGALAAVSPASSNSSSAVMQMDGQGGGRAQCRCYVDTTASFVFYNRVPKCGSTTMVNYMDEACQAKGEYNGKPWKGFSFVQSTDFDSSHFHPNYFWRQMIVGELASHANELDKVQEHEGRSMFERHMHFLDFHEFGMRVPVYLNLLRDPTSMRASSFYFFRECVCDQRPQEGDDYADEWCKSHWWRKSEAFCQTDINTCYQDLKACEAAGHSLGGSTLTDFTCGASDPNCDDPGVEQFGNGRPMEWSQRFQAKVDKSISNLENEYRWVGILERMEDSLRLLSTLLPKYFGKMDPVKWGKADVAPDGSAGSIVKSYPKPSDGTRQRMMADPYFLMDYKVYQSANDLLSCKMAGCGQSTTQEAEQRDLEVMSDKMISRSAAKVYVGKHALLSKMSLKHAKGREHKTI